MEDVTSQLLPDGGEGNLEQQPAEPQPAPEPTPEPFRLKYRGEERELPYEPVLGLAGALDTTPEGVINALQRAREADRISRENIRLQQQLEQLQNQEQAARYQEQMGGGQAPYPRTYQPQYREPQHQQQPYQPQPRVDEEDPIAMLKELRQGLSMTQQQFNQFVQAAQYQQQLSEQAREQEYLAQQGQQIESQLQRFLNEKNKGRKEPIDIEDFAEEVYLSGGGNRHVPIEHAMERAYLWMTRDEQFQKAADDQLEKLRQPKAVVTVPGGRGNGAIPKPAPNADNLDLSQIPMGKFSF